MSPTLRFKTNLEKNRYGRNESDILDKTMCGERRLPDGMTLLSASWGMTQPFTEAAVMIHNGHVITVDLDPEQGHRVPDFKRQCG